MTRATFTIAVAFLSITEAATSPPVTFESPCSCHDNHGKHRWSVKNDPSLPPTDATAIQTALLAAAFPRLALLAAACFGTVRDPFHARASTI
jgi:hypothetical protein